MTYCRLEHHSCSFFFFFPPHSFPENPALEFDGFGNSDYLEGDLSYSQYDRSSSITISQLP